MNQGVARIAAGGHGIVIADGNASEFFKIPQISGHLGIFGHNQHKVIGREIFPRGGVNNFGLPGLVHGGLIGGGENIHGRAFHNLFQ